MPRTFSLARLLLALTLLCLLCGLAVNYPEQVLASALIAGAFIPAAIVCLTLVSFSRRRISVLLISMSGAAAGVLLGPAPIHIGAHSSTVWEAVQPLYVELSFLAALGAFLLGGAALADDIFQRRR